MKQKVTIFEQSNFFFLMKNVFKPMIRFIYTRVEPVINPEPLWPWCALLQSTALLSGAGVPTALLINKLINDASCIVTGYLRPTPMDNLFVSAGILSIKLCHKQAMLSLARQAKRPKHLLHKRLLSSPCVGQQQLKLRHLFVPAENEEIRDRFKVKIFFFS